jgi:hypothetical protein
MKVVFVLRRARDAHLARPARDVPSRWSRSGIARSLASDEILRSLTVHNDFVLCLGYRGR